jgi:homoprotocatechuate degradation regulator HpaR
MTTKPAQIKHRNLPLLLLQARESVFANFRPILHTHGVTEQQWRVIRALLEQGPMEPKRICEVCRILSPSLAGMLSRMDDLGLVKRARLDHDQRRLLVSLTPKSRALAAKMSPQIEATYIELEAKLGERFTRDLYATLDSLIEVLGTPGEDDEDGDA